jgi:lysophospholipase L1-like esterase
VVLRLAYWVRDASVDRVPIPYVFGQVYGPVPPWMDGLRLLEDDPLLLWKGKPGAHRRYVDVFSPVETEAERTRPLRQFLPIVPPSLEGNPVWEVRLDSRGFRTDEFASEKPPGTFRIACLGDSWTFGGNVGQDDAYPQRLEALLRARPGGDGVEVLNLGVLGYSSYQGRVLLETHVRTWRPDVVTIGFAMNDASVAGYRDAEAAKAVREAPGWPLRVARLGEHVEIYRLLRYLAALVRFRPPSPGDHLWQVNENPEDAPYLVPGAAGLVDYARLEGRSRVGVAAYEENVRAMIALAREVRARVVLLYNELAPQSPYRGVLRRVSADAGVPLVDGSELIANARRRKEEELERRFDLVPPPGGDSESREVRVVLRVLLGDRPGPAYVVGSDEQLGAYEPNAMGMHDDGTHGDQRAGDGVWSLEATFPRGKRVFYMYTAGGRRGEWEGLDVPQIRAFQAQGASPGYRPIETFGTIYMQADGWHTDMAGNALIAEALALHSAPN